MKYWWVNQNKTFDISVEGGFLWSPKRTKNGRRYPFYDHMTQVQPGDAVFAFAEQHIKAIAIVSGPHSTMLRPESFKAADSEWSNEGWTVPVQYHEVDAPLEVRNHMDTLAALRPDKYSPIKANGNANEAYLCPVPNDMAAELIRLLKQDPAEIREWQEAMPDARAQSEIEGDETLSPTDKKQLIKARVGQGVFREKVCAVESVCRVTGTNDPKFLIASHIKPWAESDNQQRLDGNNGLMLAPHIDRLFDRRLISFGDDGALILSPVLPASIRAAWGVEQKLPLKPFNAKQIQYLSHHRERLLGK